MKPQLKNPLSADDWTQLAGLLPHVRVIHHVRGRLRLRLQAGLLNGLAQWPGATPETWLAQLPGITALHLNKAAASLVIEYDARRIPPSWWEQLLCSQHQALPTRFAEIGLNVDRDYVFSTPEGASL